MKGWFVDLNLDADIMNQLDELGEVQASFHFATNLREDVINTQGKGRGGGGEEDPQPER